MRMLCSVVSITGIILYHRNCRRHSKHAKSYPRVTPSFSPSRCKHFEILTHARTRCTARFAFARGRSFMRRIFQLTLIGVRFGYGATRERSLFRS